MIKLIVCVDIVESLFPELGVEMFVPSLQCKTITPEICTVFKLFVDHMYIAELNC